MKNVRTVIFTSYFWPHSGGVENYTLQMAKLLSKNGYNSTIITCNTEKKRKTETVQNIKVCHLDCWHLFNKTLPIPKINQTNFNLIKIIFDKSPEIIITETRFAPICLWGTYLARKNKIPYVHIEHGSGHIEDKNVLINFIFHLYDHIFGKWIIKNAVKNIAISSKGLKFLKHLGSKSPDLIHNSIMVKDFPLRKKDEENQKDIVYIGRLIEQKGVQVLIQAFQMLKTAHRLILVGDGNFSSKLCQAANGNPNIVFTGELKADKVKKVLKNAIVFVNPSYNEGLPSTILEAGATGVPVIATNVGGTSDIIKNGKNGFLVPPKNPKLLAQKINLLLRNKRLREKFSIEIHQTVKNDFDWSENIKKITETLNKCLQKN